MVETRIDTTSVRISRIEWVLLAVALAAGLVVRLALWHTQPYVSIDGTSYIRLAWEILGGPAYESVQPPGYPLLIVAMKALVPDWVLAARLVDLSAGLGLIVLIWLLARSYIRNPWFAVAPAVAVALLPLPVRYSLTTMSEAPYLVFLVGMFLLLDQKRRSPCVGHPPAPHRRGHSGGAIGHDAGAHHRCLDPHPENGEHRRSGVVGE